MGHLRIITWHVHGTYLRALAHLPHELVVPVRDDGTPGYGRFRPGSLRPANVVEVPAADLAAVRADVVVHQSHRNWLVDRHEVLSDEQRRLPSIVVEHDPPRDSPFDTRHPVDDQRALVVHVTAFNRLMWDNGDVPTTVIDHGVPEPRVAWTGELPRGLVVINGLPDRGRRLGLDVVERLRRAAPVDVVGMGSEAIGGLGEVPMLELAALMSRYRVYVSPIRWTSLSMATCEAMSIGMPVVGLATTELVTVVREGWSGHLTTDVDELVRRVRDLIEDPVAAARLGAGAAATARRRFAMSRFVAEWDAVLQRAVGDRRPATAAMLR